MDLSVIILSFNTKELTIKTVGSVINDSSITSKEIIVVDNNSTDGSVEALKKIDTHGNKLGIVENKQNFGFAKANNQGLRQSVGKYKLLLNSDTEIRKGLLYKLVKFAETKSDCGAVVPKLINKDNSIQGSVYFFPTISRAISHFWLRRKKYFDKYAPRGNKVVEVESAVMAAFLLTPAAINTVGYLDERYFMYFEDMDYCRKLNKAGLKIYYLPEAEVVHYHGASGKNLVNEANQWRRLIPSSRTYHGLFKYCVIYFIIRTNQIWEKLRQV